MDEGGGNEAGGAVLPTGVSKCIAGRLTFPYIQNVHVQITSKIGCRL